MSSTIDYSAIITNEPLPGVTPNPNATDHKGAVLIAFAIILVLISTAFVVVRIYTKAFLTRALGWDDYTCVAALIGTFIWTGFNCECRLGIGRKDWDTFLTVRDYEKYNLDHWAAETTYFPTAGLIKTSLVLLYLRVFSSNRTLRHVVYGVLLVVVVAHLGAIVGTVADDRPLSCHWLYLPSDEDYDKLCKEYWDDIYIYLTMSVLTIVLDLVILILPCPEVWRLNMPKRQKLGVMIIILTGLVISVTLVSILRLVFIVQWTYRPGAIGVQEWEFRVNLSGTFELNLGLICVCLPTLKAFLKTYAPRMLQLTSSNHATGLQSNNRSTHGRSHLDKSARKWPIETNEERLTGAVYLELNEDRKSDHILGSESDEVAEGQTGNIQAESTQGGESEIDGSDPTTKEPNRLEVRLASLASELASDMQAEIIQASGSDEDEMNSTVQESRSVEVDTASLTSEAWDRNDARNLKPRTGAEFEALRQALKQIILQYVGDHWRALRGSKRERELLLALGFLPATYQCVLGRFRNDVGASEAGLFGPLDWWD
ncbi:hypothetical protein MMC07_006177 [Pseudocyphellaria aurata]|nr:hypothetical protein [Pseudocyphellaria aurata]